MNYRTALLLAAEDLGVSGTKTINIDIDRPISRIDMTYTVTRGSQTMLAGIPACITRIELVDGSTPLHSLTGYENQGLAYYNRPGVVMGHGQHISTSSEVGIYTLDFGRWLWDEILAFDPKRHTNPQLKVTFNEVATDASASAGTLEVWAHIFDEKEISPMGFLSAIEHFDYTLGADNSFELVSIPDDRVIRQILVRAFITQYEPWYVMDEIRFDEGTLDRVPWEYTDLEMYYRRMKSVWPMIKQQITIAPSSGGETYYVPMSDYLVGLAGVGMGGTEEPYFTNASARGGYLAVTQTATNHLAGLVWGYLPWHCFQFPMGMKDVIEDWYNPAGKKPRLRMRANGTRTTAVGQVVLEELYKY